MPAGHADPVTMAFVRGTKVSFSWVRSWVDLIGWDFAHEARVLRGGYIDMRYGSGGLIAARNDTVKMFLSDMDAPWLWWVDTDMGFAADTVDRLAQAADPKERPIVGGLCFAMVETQPDGMGGFRVEPKPTIYDWVSRVDGKQGFTIRTDYERDVLLEGSGTGSACILIHRSVLAKMQADFGDVWYDPLRNPTTGDLLAEDLSFCARAKMAGFPLHLHTGVRTTHHKEVWLGEDLYDRWRAEVLADVH